VFPDWLLVILKYAGGIIAAFYGVYATLTDFKEEENGKKVLTRKGYMGICFLVIIALLSLSTDVLKDLKENQDKDDREKAERVRRDEDINRIQNITSGLTSVERNLGEQLSISRDNTEVLKRNTQDMKTQIGISGDISNDLSGAVFSLQKNAQMTRGVLSDTKRILSPLESISFFFRYDVQASSPTLKEYLRKVGEKVKAEHSNFKSPGDGHYSIGLPTPGKVTPGWLPDEDENSELLSFTNPAFQCLMFKANSSNKNLVINSFGSQPDLCFFVTATEEDKGLHFVYDLVSGSMEGYLQTQTQLFALKSGNLSSFLDLEGSLLVVYVRQDFIENVQVGLDVNRGIKFEGHLLRADKQGSMSAYYYVLQRR